MIDPRPSAGNIAGQPRAREARSPGATFCYPANRDVSMSCRAGKDAGPYLFCARLATVLAFTSAMHAAPVRAQASPPGNRFTSEIGYLSANVLLAGVAAGIIREIGGGSFRDAFAPGALGGGIAYGGRRLAVEDFQGAGLIGRQVSAVGASIALNAGAGRAALAEIHFPVGPVIVRVDRGEQLGVSATLDLYTTGWLLSALLDDRLAFDAGASMSAGAPVFRVPRHKLEVDGDEVLGATVGGVIVLGHNAGKLPGRDTFAHERVHILQYDFTQLAWFDPLETWLGDRVPGGPVVLRFVRPRLAYGLLRPTVSALDLKWRSRPWEIEAEFLEHR